MKRRNPEACCLTCPFWSLLSFEGRDEKHGECRKNAPVYGFPETLELDWCGDHPGFFKVPEAPPVPEVRPLQARTMGSKNK